MNKKQKFWFTFGQQHVHSVDGVTFDKDLVVEIEAEDYNAAREKMAETFGLKWAFQYDEMPDMDYFPRGIYTLSALKN